MRLNCLTIIIDNRLKLYENRPQFGPKVSVLYSHRDRFYSNVADLSSQLGLPLLSRRAEKSKLCGCLGDSRSRTSHQCQVDQPVCELLCLCSEEWRRLTTASVARGPLCASVSPSTCLCVGRTVTPTPTSAKWTAGISLFPLSFSPFFPTTLSPSPLSVSPSLPPPSLFPTLSPFLSPLSHSLIHRLDFYFL